MTTTLTPACFRVGSSVDSTNLSGPAGRYHSPARGLIARFITSSGVALPFEPTRLYQTTMFLARASSWSRVIAGTTATQRGRTPQFSFMISSSNSAVVAGSIVTSFSSGGGGVFAVFQSEMISALNADPNDATSNAMPMAGRRISVMVFLLCVQWRSTSPKMVHPSLATDPEEISVLRHPNAQRFSHSLPGIDRTMQWGRWGYRPPTAQVQNCLPPRNDGA